MHFSGFCVLYDNRAPRTHSLLSLWLTSKAHVMRFVRDDYVNKLVPSQGIISPNEVRGDDGSGSAGFSRRLTSCPLLFL